ncbi:MAG: cysteine desulfurase [Solobacterium sp.]|nr:cysteine desulfurase [Solobacterium sp.]
MFDLEKIRQDFPMLKNHPELVYFDNGATTFKPQVVIDKVEHYYTHATANVHRGDYALSVEVDRLYDETRAIVARFLNCDASEVAFLHNDTECLNQIVYGLSYQLKKGDIVLTSVAEHASNLLPWYRLKEQLGIEIKYLPVNAQGVVDLEAAKALMSKQVKVIALAHVTNVLGSVQPIQELCELAHQYGAYMVVDGAQSVPHRKVDVKALDLDFLTFSSHKMCGPNGVGVLYGKKELLENIPPLVLGGGMNARFQSDGSVLLKDVPTRFEAGTPNIEGVIGFGAACEYLMDIGMDQIHNYEKELRSYFAEQIKPLAHIQFYNPDNATGPITFNAKEVFAQDAAGYLASKNIAVRSGNHCAKILHELIGTDSTIRASLYFYNTKEEVDRCVEAIKEISIENAIGVFF